jgi:hypothetical protein
VIEREEHGIEREEHRIEREEHGMNIFASPVCLPHAGCELAGEVWGLGEVVMIPAPRVKLSEVSFQ